MCRVCQAPSFLISHHFATVEKRVLTAILTAKRAFPYVCWSKFHSKITLATYYTCYRLHTKSLFKNLNDENPMEDEDKKAE
jgi:hypothetical protein